MRDPTQKKIPKQPSRAKKTRVSFFNAARQIFHATCRAKHNHTRCATIFKIFLKRLIFDGENRPKRQNFPQTSPRDNFPPQTPYLAAFGNLWQLLETSSNLPTQNTAIIAKMRQGVKLPICYADTFKIPQILRSSAICSLCGNFASSAETYPPMYARLFPAPNRRPYRSVIFLHSSGRRSFLPRRGKCRAY